MEAIKKSYTWAKDRTPTFLVGGAAGFVVTKFNLLTLLLGVL